MFRGPEERVRWEGSGDQSLCPCPYHCLWGEGRSKGWPGGGAGLVRTGPQRTLLPPLLPPLPSDRGLWVSEHNWLLSLTCHTAAPLDRAKSKRWLPQGHTRAIQTYRSLSGRCLPRPHPLPGPG